MKPFDTVLRKRAQRRSFLKKAWPPSAATVGAGLLSDSFPRWAPNTMGNHRRRCRHPQIPGRGGDSGDRSLGAVHGTRPGRTRQTPATKPDSIQLDGDMPQYISDNTDDELSHELFINAYLKSKGAKPVDLEQFRTLEGSQVTDIPGVASKKRLTNLSSSRSTPAGGCATAATTRIPTWATRFRTLFRRWRRENSRLFPRNNAELEFGNTNVPVNTHVQAIANTAGFHFAFIEQGGTSLYASLAQRRHPTWKSCASC